ncbi:MAG: transposase, partial [Candidatus Riflebacteria bacterium]|nr:transposase [Candidatus Riflebacteria bacterium]
MPSKKQARADLDSPWKEALDLFLGPFLSLFYPIIHAEIDWERGYEILDKELQRISHDARVGRRLADKLFKVWLRDGQEAWLLIHIEVQGRKEPGFAERMFIYSYRIYDRYRKPVVSLAVLCDEDPDWRPDRFGYERWGSSHDFRFLMVKLIDLRSDEAALESNRNVFAPIVLAQLKASETRGTPEERRRWKVRLVKGLYDRGLTAEKVRQLFRLIDWMMELPKDQELEFR